MLKFFYFGPPIIDHILLNNFQNISREDTEVFILNRLQFTKTYGGKVVIQCPFVSLKVQYFPKNSILMHSKLYAPKFIELMGELMSEIQTISEG